MGSGEHLASKCFSLKTASNFSLVTSGENTRGNQSRSIVAHLSNNLKRPVFCGQNPWYARGVKERPVEKSSRLPEEQMEPVGGKKALLRREIFKIIADREAERARKKKGKH